jgi:hypothetical protein
MTPQALGVNVPETLFWLLVYFCKQYRNKCLKGQFGVKCLEKFLLRFVTARCQQSTKQTKNVNCLRTRRSNSTINKPDSQLPKCTDFRTILIFTPKTTFILTATYGHNSYETGANRVERGRGGGGYSCAER